MAVDADGDFLPICGDQDKTEVLGKMPALLTVKVEPVGRWFEAYSFRRRHKQSLSQHSLRSASSEDEEEEVMEDDEDDEKLLQTLDPKEWKNQDHYAVLGLAKLRINCTEEQIKAAYKRKVLKHHPDKRKARGLPVKEGDDDYFTCITRAYEILGNTLKRRSYDSVDPEFDDSVPSASAENKENFYEVFGPVFARNARWSTSKKRAPKFGDDKATYEEVNNFYTFWYDFDSWREYSYLDEEEKEKGENREERRWIEKQNKAARQKRKKEEVVRIRQLVDNAYNSDPRIQRFKDEEKQKKLAQKQAKKDAARARQEEEERIRREAEEKEREKREKEEEEARKQAETAKKEREAQKKALKKERKTLRGAMKEFEYFATSEKEKVDNMADVDKLAELLSVTSLQELNKELTSGDKGKAKVAFEAQVRQVNEQIEDEKRRNLEAGQKASGGGSDENQGSKAAWSEAELQTLVKGVKSFPAGTVARWETIANFIEQHVPGSKRAPKEVLNKAKELQKAEASQSLKADVNKRAFDKFMADSKSAASAEKADISKRMDTVAVQQIGETGSNPAPWTSEEQRLLEQALKTYPANTPERWERIAEAVSTRSKKDCMKRYKELVELVRAKKAAQAATAKGKK